MGFLPKKKQIDYSPILSRLFWMYTKLQYLLLSDKAFMERAYKKRFNKDLDWANPKTYQEKLQWLKLYHRTDLQTKCADKVDVRDFIRETLGDEYLIPQHFVTKDHNDLTKDKLPDNPFIVKCNHNSAAYTIVRNKEMINWKKEKIKFKNLLRQNYYYQSREWQYKNIEPKIIVEELLLDEQGNIPLDYKFYCFNGEPKAIHVSVKRNDIHYVIFFDPKWNKLPLKYDEYSNDIPGEIPKPIMLDEMARLARILSAHSPFARIDFYFNKNKIYFGEITYHPGSGLHHYTPDPYERTMGDWIDLTDLMETKS